MVAAFSAWLEDDKLERFWHPLRRDAEVAIDRLDQRLSQISQRRGLDITGSTALGREQSLLSEFNGQLGQLSNLGAQGFDAAQRAMVAAFVGAFQQAASAVRADAGAGTFVAVAWPQ